MTRNAFYSFHFQPDHWRAGQVRNMGMIEGNNPVSDNDWEAIKGRGDAAIRTWIDGQLAGRSCTVVLIGSATAGRRWIDYEITKSWNDGKGVVGIYVHNLKDQFERQSTKGSNPFASHYVGSTPLSSVVTAYDPPFTYSSNVYSHIKDNLARWVEEAIVIRSRY